MFFQIVRDVITPIFLLIGLGFAVQRWIGLESRTLTRLNFWIFVPAFLFVHIYEFKLSGGDLATIVTHFVLLFSSMALLSYLTARLLGLASRMRRALIATVLFYNSGNYGIPVAKLAFTGGAGDVALQVQAIMVMLQNISNFTIGLAIVAGGRGRSRRDTLRAILRLPMVYVLVTAWSWRITGLPMVPPLLQSLHFLSDGLVPVALITLGAQMALLRSHRFSRDMVVSLALRLCLGPLLGCLIVLAMRVHGQLAQALAVSTSFPTAVNAALLAMEFDNEPDFAAAVVFYSTLISAVTVSIVIYIVKQMVL